MDSEVDLTLQARAHNSSFVRAVKNRFGLVGRIKTTVQTAGKISPLFTRRVFRRQREHASRKFSTQSLELVPVNLSQNGRSSHLPDRN